MEPLFLYCFEVESRRGGSLTGAFIAMQSEVDEMIGKELYFGEVMGKHSEVRLIMRSDMMTKVDVSDSTVQDLRRACGATVSGINPVQVYLNRKEEEDEDLE